MDEKVLPRTRRFNALGYCLTVLRIWQWSSAFFAWASFSLLYGHIQKNQLGENDRMKGIQVLGLVSVVYSTLVILCVHVLKTLGQRTWRVFAVCSLPGDLTLMGICIAKITILSFSGVPADCHGLTRDNYDGSDLIRQPADGYTTIRFGSWAMDMTGELDRLCTFPRTVYGLSVVAIFSYTFSLLLSVLYLQQQQKQASLDNEKVEQPQPSSSPRPTLRYLGDHPHHHPHYHAASSSMHAPSILDLDDAPSGPPSPHSLSRPTSPPRPPTTNCGTKTLSTTSSRTSQTSSSSSSSSSDSSVWGATTTTTTTTLVSSASDDDDDGDSESVISGTFSVISGTSLPPRPLPGSSSSSAPPPRRWSTSTSSSFNANAFIVTDGFRPLPAAAAAAGGPSGSMGAVTTDPPAYSSRPGSLYHESMKYDAGLGKPGTPKP